MAESKPLSSTDDNANRHRMKFRSNKTDTLQTKSLTTQLIRVFISNLIILVAIGGFAISALIFTNSSRLAIINSLEPLAIANKKLMIDVLQSTTAAKNYLITGQNSYVTDFDSAHADFLNQISKMAALSQNNKHVNSLISKEKLRASAVFSVEQHLAISLSSSTRSSTQLVSVLQSFNQKVVPFQNENSIANQYLIELKNKSIENSTRIEDISLVITIAGILIAFVFMLSRAIKTRSEVASLIERLKSRLLRVHDSNSDMSTVTHRYREEADIVEAINVMAAQISSLFSQLENKFSEEKVLREGLEYEQSLRESLSQSIYRDLDVSSALQRTLEGFGSALHADRAIVRVVAQGLPGQSFSEWISPSMQSAEDITSFEGSDLERLMVYERSPALSSSIQSGVTVVVNDVETDERIPMETRQAAASTGLASFITVPVIGINGSEAVLVASSEGVKRNWSTRDIQTAETMARGLAATMTAIRLYEQERKSLESLKELDKTKDNFIASISHELRTPLTSIVGYLEILEDELHEGNIDNKFGRMLDAIGRNSQRLLSLIENILTASRIDSGVLELDQSTVHVSPLFSRVAETIEPQIRSKELDLQITVDDSLPEFQADFALLERVLFNLTSNAIKFTPPKGTVQMLATSEEGKLIIAVTDTGVGIAPDEIDKLFTKFYRATTARDNVVQGTGLGLVIVKAIVEKHKGKITVSSELGKGTTFKIELPLFGKSKDKT